MTKVIKFSHNWNSKLDQQYFTTIRRYSDSKWDYYTGCVDELFEVLLEGNKKSDAKLINVERYVFDELPEGLKVVDTGQQRNKEIFRKFGILDRTHVLVLTFRNLKGQKFLDDYR